VSHYHRRSIRLQGYDYTQSGAYFVTLCTHQRDCLFATISVDGELILNDVGRIVEEEWCRSAEIRKEIELDTFAVMPNHLHGIVVISRADVVGATGRSPLPPVRPGPASHSLGALIAGFKSATTKRINLLRKTPGQPVWQRNYYEHIVRNERDLNAIRIYIENNPMNWALDRENPAAKPVTDPQQSSDYK
jgi:REP element-mobilizing transposase RayT